MSVALQIDLDELKKLVSQCDTEEKIELVRQLENETFSDRLSRLRDKLSAADLSIDDITKEVESVRKQRYDH